MLTESIVDMLPFLAVYFIGVLAFADAFESIEYVLELTGEVEVEEIDTEGLNFYQKNMLPYVTAI